MKKKAFNKILFSSFLLVKPLSAFSMPYIIPEENMFIPRSVAKQADISFENGNFEVILEGKLHKIQESDVYFLPKDLNEEKLFSFLNHGYLTLKKIGNDYGIEGKIRGLGGGIEKETEKPSSPSSGWIETLQKTMGIANTFLEHTNHRTIHGWFNGDNHRTIQEWLAQKDHRSPWEWLTGVPSRNKKANEKIN